MKRLPLAWIILIFSLLSLISCGGADGGDTGDRYTVAITPVSGVIVTSENPIRVEEGGTAVFDIELVGGVTVKSVSAGRFDPSTGTITVTDVRNNMRITVTLAHETFAYRFYGLAADTSSAPDGLVRRGSEITVTAGSETREFLGFSVNGYLSDGGEALTTQRSYTFTASADMVYEGDVIRIYANYADTNVIYYSPNGGSVNSASPNASHTTYYHTRTAAGKLRVEYGEEYFDKVGAASTFWDDGTFTREGYVLREYNTAPDGTGEGYSLGSKFPMNGEAVTLYCIWAPDTEHTDFEYEDVNIPLPAGTKSAPHWVENGIIINSYKGNSIEVTVPEKIGDKYVIAIAEGAFVDKSVETLTLSRRIVKVENGAFKNCTSLNTVYYPDGIYYVNNEAFDTASFAGVKNFYVNATVAPRYANTVEGAFAMKLTRLLVNSYKPRVVVVSGSSTLQGFSAPYVEELLDGEYAVINFGTTRTTQGYMWLEAMGTLGNEEDIIIYAPENSIYMLGEPTLYWKTIRDLEGCYNIFRCIDISGYDNVIGAFAALNRGDPDDEIDPLAVGRYEKNPVSYEDMIKVTSVTEYGEYLHGDAAKYCDDTKYSDLYTITLNSDVRSTLEGLYNKDNSTPEEDRWCKLTDKECADNMNRAIAAAKISGAKVYFSFAPADADKLTDEAKADISSHCASYDALIMNTYDFDGLVGSSGNYIFNHVYFYNNAFHTNYYGRVWRSYTLYTDLALLLGKDVKDYNSEGFVYDGCLFEMVGDNKPLYKVDYMN